MTLQRYGARALFVALAGVTAISTAGEGVARGHATPHADVPQIETDGGPVVSTPRIVPILYSSDPLLGPLTDYFAKLGASGYLAGALGEYGVTSVTVDAPVIITDPPPSSIGDLDMSIWLGGLIDLGTLPPADGSTTLHVILPSTTAVISGEFYGNPVPTCTPGISEAYSSANGIASFSYVPRCEGSTFGLGDLDYVTARGTAALADAILNPYRFEAPAYGEASWHGSGWAGFGQDLSYANFNLGEMCLATLHQATTIPAGIGYLVPRIWSNQAAATGHDPCAETSPPQGSYFNAAPDIAGGTQYAVYNFVKGVVLPAGGSVKIPLRLFSDGPTCEWKLSAVERTDLEPDPSGVLSFSFDKTSGSNGDVRQLTVERSATSDGSVAENLAFDIVSTNGTETHEWLVMVGNE